MSSAALGVKALFGKFLNTGSINAVDNGNEGAVSLTSNNIESDAVDLAYCVVDHYTGGLAGLRKLGRRVPSCSKTLLRMVDHMSERHQILFNSIVTRLKASHENIAPTFSNVVNEMFGDNQYNWGRVVTVYAFAGWLARYVCCSKDPDVASDPLESLQCATEIAKLAGEFVAERLGGWVRKQGGWDVMNEFFTDREDPEGAMWHSLLYTFVGLGALATMAAAAAVR